MTDPGDDERNRRHTSPPLRMASAALGTAASLTLAGSCNKQTFARHRIASLSSEAIGSMRKQFERLKPDNSRSSWMPCICEQTNENRTSTVSMCTLILSDTPIWSCRLAAVGHSYIAPLPRCATMRLVEEVLLVF